MILGQPCIAEVTPPPDARHFSVSAPQSKPPCIEWLLFRLKLNVSEADRRHFDFQLGAGVIRKAWALQDAVIPAKAGIHSANLWWRQLRGMSIASRSHSREGVNLLRKPVVVSVVRHGLASHIPPPSRNVPLYEFA